MFTYDKFDLIGVFHAGLKYYSKRATLNNLNETALPFCRSLGCQRRLDNLESNRSKGRWLTHQCREEEGKKLNGKNLEAVSESRKLREILNVFFEGFQLDGSEFHTQEFHNWRSEETESLKIIVLFVLRCARESTEYDVEKCLEDMILRCTTIHIDRKGPALSLGCRHEALDGSLWTQESPRW